MVQLPTDSGDTIPMLLASSATEGLVAYPWTFRRANALSSVEDIKSEGGDGASQSQGTGTTAYVVSSMDDAIAAFEILDPASAPDRVPTDSLGTLSTRILFGMSAAFPDGVLEGARALRLDVDPATGSAIGVRVARGLPLSNLMCGPIKTDFAGQHAWQAYDYGAGCNTVQFRLSSQSDTPPADVLLTSLNLTSHGTLELEPVERVSGTVLLKASIEAVRFSQAIGEQGSRAGNQHLLWATVLKTNMAPDMVVQNVSVQVRLP